MKGLPVVTIVGRQNVGKSTLFNAILRAQSAITENTAGVTRDVLQKTVERSEFKIPFTLSDTPGLDIENIDEISKEIIEIAFEHLRNSDLILHVIDHKDLRKYDHRLIELFKKDEILKDKMVLTLINKVDTEQDEYDLEPFYKLGLNELLPISALGRRNFDLLYQKINFFFQTKSKCRKTRIVKLPSLGNLTRVSRHFLTLFLDTNGQW